MGKSTREKSNVSKFEQKKKIIKTTTIYVKRLKQSK